MKERLLVALLTATILAASALCSAKEEDRSDPDRLWESSMLAGQAHPASGHPPLDVPGDHYSGEPYIYFQDLEGTALLGLLRGGGWTMEGGMIGSVPKGSSRIELFVKHITRHRPGLIDNYFYKKEDWWYEYFLLLRKEGASQARIVQKWIIPPQEIQWFVPGREGETNIPPAHSGFG